MYKLYQMDLMMPALKSISASALRAKIRRVINEVGYGQAEYLVEKFGEPTAAVISVEDFRFLQAARQQQVAASLDKGAPYDSV